MEDEVAESVHHRPPGGAPAVEGWRRMGADEPLFQRAADQIERHIASNGLSPGDRLPGERELCVLLGVSRASVREALRSLQARGVVGVRHGKGVFVAAPDEGERALRHFARLREVGLDELFAMREVLEVPAAGWAAVAASDGQLQALSLTFHTLEQAVADGRPARELQIIDSRLHLQITGYASNRFLTMSQEVLQEMLARSMETTLSISGRPARSVEEHADIVKALRNRDPRQARAAARHHIHSAHRAAARRMEAEHRHATAAPGPAVSPPGDHRLSRPPPSRPPAPGPHARCPPNPADEIRIPGTTGRSAATEKAHRLHLIMFPWY